MLLPRKLLGAALALGLSLAGADVASEPDRDARHITYRKTATGLVIETDGVRIEPRAEPIKRKDGTWNARVSVRVSATDGRLHRLTSPAGGPLMMAAELDRGASSERVSDKKEGDGEEIVADGAPVETARELPAKDVKGVGKGQSMTLWVGLWGLAAEGDPPRVVRKLFSVRMVVGSHRPAPVISPPE